MGLCRSVSLTLIQSSNFFQGSSGGILCTILAQDCHWLSHCKWHRSSLESDVFKLLRPLPDILIAMATSAKSFHHLKSLTEAEVYIYIYAFSRRFYPKRLTVHAGYTFFSVFTVCSLGIKPTTFCAANAMLYHWDTETFLQEQV